LVSESSVISHQSPVQEGSRRRRSPAGNRQGPRNLHDDPALPRPGLSHRHLGPCPCRSEDMNRSRERQGVRSADLFASSAAYLMPKRSPADNHRLPQPLVHISTPIHRGLCTSRLDNFLKGSFRGRRSPPPALATTPPFVVVRPHHGVPRIRRSGLGNPPHEYSRGGHTSP